MTILKDMHGIIGNICTYPLTSYMTLRRLPPVPMNLGEKSSPIIPNNNFILPTMNLNQVSIDLVNLHPMNLVGRSGLNIPNNNFIHVPILMSPHLILSMTKPFSRSTKPPNVSLSKPYKNSKILYESLILFW